MSALTGGPLVTASVLKKALATGAFLFASLLSIPSVAEDCPADRIDHRAKVERVYDGDTVRLGNGDRLRIIGINTPELGRDGKPSEPFSRKAQKRLIALIGMHDNLIQLRYGTESRDRYKRLLAHAYLPNGTNIGAILLREGLAARVTVPPNTHHYLCYRAAELSARKIERGIWSQPSGGVVDVGHLPVRTRGFRIVSGSVSAIDQGARRTTLVLQNRLQLRVDKRDYPYFNSGFLQGLRGKTVEVRGWISGGDNVLRMRLRHPAQLDVE